MHRPPTQIREKTTRHTAVASAVALTLILFSGCGRSDSPPPARDISNPSLAVTVTDLPPEWAVRANDDDRIELVPSADHRAGVVRVTVGPEELGVNLVASVESHKADIENRPGGHYSGAQELSGPLGAAFYSRGRYEDDGEQVEETRIVALHPTGSRLLMLDYTYPAADDSASRVGELIELFALVE